MLPRPFEQEGPNYRAELLAFNRERVEFAYLKALAEGVEDPLVLVLDLHDQRASRLAQLTGLSGQAVRRWVRRCARREAVATHIVAAPAWAVLCVVGPMSPNGGRGIAASRPPGTFRVIAMAAEGNTYANFPLPS